MERRETNPRQVVAQAHQADNSTFQWQPGDRVGWSINGTLDQGEGVIAAILPPESGETQPRYDIAVYFDGKYTGHRIPLSGALLNSIPNFDPASEALNPSVQPEHPELSHDEYIIQLGEGKGSLRCPNLDGACTYVRVLDSKGEQVAFFDSIEWCEAPELTMYALLTAIHQVAIS